MYFSRGLRREDKGWLVGVSNLSFFTLYRLAITYISSSRKGMFESNALIVFLRKKNKAFKSKK
uniref:Uncharacterized protein n=1 Tax=Strigamia maritima TaxID=126957 RepID=T1JKJ2_STRMM